MNYYEVLGVAKDASLQQIKSAYRKLVLRYHPDRNSQSKEQKLLGEEKFKQIAEAYETLGNELKRRQYDFYEGSPGSNVSNLQESGSAMFYPQATRGKCGRGLGRGARGCRAGGRGFGKSQGLRKPF
ncbi:MAG: J domain-containing protein [Desulfoferrobacter sp.]